MVRLGREAKLVLALLFPLLAAPQKEDVTIYRDAAHYSCFPNLWLAGDGTLWASFSTRVRASHWDGKGGGKTFMSSDGGRTWQEATERPRDAWALRLGDGTLMRISAGGREERPAGEREELEKQGYVVVEIREGTVVIPRRPSFAISEDGGESWQSRPIDIPHIASWCGLHGGIVLLNDTVLYPVYGSYSPDDEQSTAWVLRSGDRGASWRLVELAKPRGKLGFNEAALLQAPDGTVLAALRGGGPEYDGFLYLARSTDGGATWAEPEKTDMWGYPADLRLLENGDILCTYGYRRPPYGIRACFSRDGGRAWDTENEVVLRTDGAGDGNALGKGSAGDLGYPMSAELGDGSIVTVYYFTTDPDWVTHIAATRWTPAYIGPEDLPRGAAAIRKPDPSLPPENIVGDRGYIVLTYGVMQSFIPTEPQIGMVAVRVSRHSARFEHTNGLYVAIRKPGEESWWTEFLGRSKPIVPADVKLGGWNAFEFDPPVAVEPGEVYVLTVYNRDYTGGGETKLVEGLTGDHSWVLNSGDNYPNGGIGPERTLDIAFKVYAEPGPLPET